MHLSLCHLKTFDDNTMHVAFIGYYLCLSMNTSIVRIIFIFQWDFKSEWEFAYNGIRPTSIISPFIMLIEHAIIWTAVHCATRLHNTSWLSQNDIGHASRLIPNLAPNLIYRELIVHVVARCAVCGVCMAGTACRSCFRCLLRFTFKWKLCDLLVNSYSGNKCFRVAVSFNC